MISLLSAGWFNEGGYGAIGAACGTIASTGLPDKTEVFKGQFRNFGRLDPSARAACYAVGLALKAAGMDNAQPETGIVGASYNGCADADMRYFKDYMDGGRKLGRGNLFIYTLPTSPLAEASIHFGLTGPILYAQGLEGRLPLFDAVSTALALLKDGEAEAMLSGQIEGGHALFMLLGVRHKALCGADEALNMIGLASDIKGVIKQFEPLAAGAHGVRGGL